MEASAEVRKNSSTQPLVDWALLGLTGDITTMFTRPLGATVDTEVH